MALITLCGLPSSGKSHRAAQLQADFAALGAAEQQQSPSPPARTVHLVSDHDLHIERNAYANAATEKTARASLLSAARRALGRDTVVLLDAPNYIKGWRYQLHCEAKALGVRSAVVQLGTPPDTARSINEQRSKRAVTKHSIVTEDATSSTPAQETLGSAQVPTPFVTISETAPQSQVNGSATSDPYDNSLWEDLAYRFEEPNGMSRWDSPLYVIAWDDERPPSERIWNEVVRGRGRGGAALAAVRPNQATVAAKPADASHLQALERQTQDVVSQILAWQVARTEAGGEPGGEMTVTLPAGESGPNVGDKPILHLPTQTRLSQPHLQRLRRQFVALHRQQMGGAGMGAIGKGDAAHAGLGKGRVAALFVDWLNDAFERS